MVNRQRIRPRNERIGQERWMVSYADFITLLFGFFVVLYSAAQGKDDQSRQLLASLSQTLQVTSTQLHVEPALAQPQLAKLAAKQAFDNPQAFAEELSQHLAGWGDEHQARISSNGDWVEIDLNANWLFASGSAVPNSKALPLLQDLAGQLRQVDVDINVFGHTDNQPIRTQQYASNWALSAARAVAVVDLLTAAAVDPAHMSAVGYGEFRPLLPNDSEAGRARNRRVVLRLTKPARASQESPAILVSAANEPTPESPRQSSAAPDTIEPLVLESGGLLFARDLAGRR